MPRRMTGTLMPPRRGGTPPPPDSRLLLQGQRGVHVPGAGGTARPGTCGGPGGPRQLPGQAGGALGALKLHCGGKEGGCHPTTGSQHPCLSLRGTSRVPDRKGTSQMSPPWFCLAAVTHGCSGTLGSQRWYRGGGGTWDWGTPGWHPRVLGDTRGGGQEWYTWKLGDPRVAPSAPGCRHLRTPARCDPSSTPRAGRTRRPGARRRGAGGSRGWWAPPDPPLPSPTPRRGCRRVGVPAAVSPAGLRPVAGTLGTSGAGRCDRAGTGGRHPGRGTPVGLGALGGGGGCVPRVSPTRGLAGLLAATLGRWVLLPLEGLRVLALAGALRVGARGGMGPQLPPPRPRPPGPQCLGALPRTPQAPPGP